MELVIGVDGGSTKTVAVASGLDGVVRGIGRGGSSNAEGLGFEEAGRVIAEAAQQALAMASSGPGDVIHGHLGLSGIDWPEDVSHMETALRECGWACPVTIENDAFLPLRTGAPEGHGIGTAAGGGVCCGIIRPDGEKYFYGAFTDLGGGIDIGGEVLQAVLRAEDGRGKPTALTEALLGATGYESVVELAYAVHREGKWVSKRTTDPVLFGCAAKGDPAAVDVVTRFGAQLALCATNLIRRYELENEDTAVVASGSLFMKTGPLLFKLFQEEVLKVAPRARLVLTDLPPAIGAVRGALAAAGRGELEVWERVRTTARESGWFAEDIGARGKELLSGD
jgi:N-acetylglucosamine kinase-like BadF-type ATPase